jgi:SAM-dependent methyltransferase
VRFSAGVREANTPVDETTLVRCETCGLLFFWPVAPASASFYPELVGTSPDYSYSETKWEFDWLLARLPPRQRVLDVGCGRGDFLARCKARGHLVTGVEADADAASRARARGIEVFEERAPGTFDWVCAFHVLEHVADPLSFVQKLAAYGAPVVLSVPNADRTWTAPMEPLDFPPHHVTRWNERSLRSLASRAGLAVETIATEPMAWETARYSYEKRIASRLGAVAGFLAARAMLPSERLYDALDMSRRMRLSGLAIAVVLRKDA